MAPTFEMVLAQPKAYEGQKVIFGGYILESRNLEDYTELVVLQAPLDDSQKPGDRENSEGRFIIRADRFLDPEIYAKDRQVTVGGIVSGVERQKLGDTVYTYPVVQSEELHLWPKPKPSRYYYPSYYSPWYSDPWYYSPWYGYYDDWPYPLYRRPFLHRPYRYWR